MKTVLIVDDEPHIVRLLQSILKPAGCRIVAAASGEQALELAAAQPVDLALIDLGLPGIDGFQTVRELRKQPGGADLPVIVLTARGQARLRRDAEAADILFMTKPFSPLDLRRQVIALLGPSTNTP